jgi:DNA repair photolyase
LDYSLNPYRGCQHGCAYCYVPNVLRISRAKWGCFVDVKKNIPVVLSKELKKKKLGVVGLSTVTDPYQSIENKYKLSRYCLEQLLIHDFPVCVQTKSALVLRDLDLISKFSDPEIMFSIGTLNEDERKMLEPGASSINDRLNALKRCSDEGIKTAVFFGPIYPTIKIEDIEKIVDTFVESGAKEIMVDKFNLKPGIGENIESKLHANPIMFKDFSKNLRNAEYFSLIEKTILDLGKKTKIRVVEAF